jgi:hypothetical protein
MSEASMFNLDVYLRPVRAFLEPLAPYPLLVGLALMFLCGLGLIWRGVVDIRLIWLGRWPRDKWDYWLVSFLILLCVTFLSMILLHIRPFR